MIKDPYYEHRQELKKKYEQKHYEKQEHSRSKSYQEGWHQEELPLDWSEPFADIEVEELFWGKLVQLGWKIQTYGDRPPLKNNFVLVCPTCNNILDTHPAKGLTKKQGKMMANSILCERILAAHSGFVCEAIAEA